MKRMRLAAVAIVGALVCGAIPVGPAALAAAPTPAAPDVVPSAAPLEVSDAVPPVIVVLDISGSMNDDDGTGRVKLTGAKGAVGDVVRSLSAAQPFGLWTYPSGADSCGSGSFAVAPARITDLNGTIARVDGLTADGGTPTGPALRAAADELGALGPTSATLVLVSDGESNCGDPPCRVAEDLATAGIDITVHAVGFRVSEAGREELNCVASTTGGRYVDVDDGQQLNDTLRELTRAKLRIQTTAQLKTLAGAPTRIAVTLSNQSTVVAGDAQLVLQFPEGKTPANLNTVLRVGNLLPGATVQRSWIIGTGAESLTIGAANPEEGRAFIVSGWARNADRVATDGVIGSPGGGDSGPVSMRGSLGDLLRHPIEAGHPLVIVGDSYSAGEGTFDYSPPVHGVSANCHRSEKTYLVPLLDPGDTVNLACSGAVTWDFYQQGRDGTPPQLRQLEDLPAAPGAVLMTLGGNDIGFEGIVRQCITSSCDTDPEQVARWSEIADSMRPWLAAVYRDVWKTVNVRERQDQRDGEFAPVIVLAYPQVTHAAKFGACGRIAASGGLKGTFGAGEVRVANQLAARLNAAVRAAVADVRNAGYEVYFVGDTADIALPDHTLCDGADAYINDVVGLGAAESIHPNVSGYAAESGAIIGWSSSVSRTGPVTGPSGPVTERVAGPTWGPRAVAAPVLRLGVTPSIDGLLLRGGQIDARGTGYLPDSPVTITLHSTPVVLGTLTADYEGSIRGLLPVPDVLELGRHEIIASGTDVDGDFREDRVTASVVDSPPPWVIVAVAGAGVLLAAALVLLVAGRRRGPRNSDRRWSGWRPIAP